jgi:carbonic anhydrase/acetyltransferase-like protein (isoleucine patch superfamily)
VPLYEFEGKAPQLPESGSAWVAPSADVIGDVHLGENVSIWFGAVIRADNTRITVGAPQQHSGAGRAPQRRGHSLHRG